MTELGWGEVRLGNRPVDGFRAERAERRAFVPIERERLMVGFTLFGRGLCWW